MTWRDQLQKGSFRGAPFQIDGHEQTGGRRIAIHEYPQRDEPYAQDIGRRADEFSVECLVIGPRYMKDRDKLLEALRKNGPGKLIHPYLGMRMVSVDRYRLRESSRDGGIATFVITFVEAGRAATAEQNRSTKRDLLVALDRAQAAFDDNFIAHFDAAGAAMNDAVRSVNNAMSSVNRMVGSVTGAVTAVLSAPAMAVVAIRGGIGQMRALVKQPRDAVGMYRDLFGAKSTSTADTNSNAPSRRAEQNRETLEQYVRRTAVLESCRATTTVQYTSASEAKSALAALTDEIDARAEFSSAIDATSVPDTVLEALTDVRTALVRDLSFRAAKAPDLSAYVPRRTEPALVIAWRLYADATRAADLVARNQIQHPGFVLGGQKLEVLNVA